MNKISHEQARQWIQSGVNQPQLADHLEGCASCRRFAGEFSAMEYLLRGSLRDHLDPMPVPPPAYSVISARMRAQTMKKQVLSFVGVTAAILLVIGLLVNLPSTIPQPGSLLRETAPAILPAEDPTAAPTASPQDAQTFSGQYLLLGAAGDRQTLNLAGAEGSARNLLESSPRITGAAWSPDGQWIAYIDTCEGVFSGAGDHPCGGLGAGVFSAAVPGPEVFVMDAAGGQVTRLTTASGLDWSAPLDWSPDGKWLAASARPLAGEGASALYLIPLDGSGPRRLSDTQGAQVPRWSPDGLWLAFTRTDSGLSALYIYQLRDNYVYQISPRPGGNLAGKEAQGRFAAARDGLYAWLPTPAGTPADAALAYLVEGPYDAQGSLLPGAEGAVLARQGIEQPRMKDPVLLEKLPVGAVLDLALSPNAQTFALVLQTAEDSCPLVQLFANHENAALLGVSGLCTAAQPGALSWSADARWLLAAGVQNARQSVFAMDAAAAMAGTASPAFFTVSQYSFDAVQPMARPNGPLLGVTPNEHSESANAELPAAAVQNAHGRLIFSGSTEPGAAHSPQNPTRLYALRPDGSALQALLDSPANQYGAVLSPDGQQVAFLLKDALGPAMPYVLRFGQPDPLLLIGQDDFPASLMQGESELSREPQPGDIFFPIYGTPVWSPDGSTLAFSVTLQGLHGKIALAPADGSQAARYIDVGFSAEGGASPVWSPDGRWLAFSLGEYGYGDLYLLDPQDETLTRLTDTPDISEGQGAAWSPDGTWLAYFARRSGQAEALEIRLIHPDGSGARTLASIPAALDGRYPYNYGLRWSPDGRYLSYAVNNSGSYGLQQYNLMLLDPQDGLVQPLFEIDEPLFIYAWSPDGQWLAYSTETGIRGLQVAESLAGQSAPAKIIDHSGVWSLQWQR